MPRRVVKFGEPENLLQEIKDFHQMDGDGAEDTLNVGDRSKDEQAEGAMPVYAGADASLETHIDIVMRKRGVSIDPAMLRSEARMAAFCEKAWEDFLQQP